MYCLFCWADHGRYHNVLHTLLLIYWYGQSWCGFGGRLMWAHRWCWRCCWRESSTAGGHSRGQAIWEPVPRGLLSRGSANSTQHTAHSTSHTPHRETPASGGCLKSTPPSYITDMTKYTIASSSTAGYGAMDVFFNVWHLHAVFVILSLSQLFLYFNYIPSGPTTCQSWIR